MTEAIGDTFREEALEILAELEISLLELERSPHDQGLIDGVFRALHTLKGSSSLVGFEAIAAFTHEIESVFELVRTGRLPVSKQLVNLTLRAGDRIRGFLAKRAGGRVPREIAGAAESIAGFRSLLPEGAPVADAPVAEAFDSQPRETERSATYRIRFRPPTDIFLRGISPLVLLRELKGMGQFRAVVQVDAVPLLEVVDPEACYLYWDVILTTDQGINAIRDVFIFLEGDCELAIAVIDDGGRLDQDQSYKRLGEILVERGDVTADELDGILGQKRRIGELLVEKNLVDRGKVDSALLEQESIQEIRRGRDAAQEVASVRVRSEKLDSLVDLIGELVTVQARLSQISAERSDPELLSVAETVERLTWELRDQVLNIRMLPIGTTFSKFRRLVRDLAAELGKEVELVTEGAETELDKTVIERLNDPLVHLIRNCIDHGIEPPSARRTAGKPERGTVRLSAAHAGADVVIRVQDDGAGLDREALRDKAVRAGLLAPGAEISDKELFNIIFLPGFSTAEQVTSVSGRGVGMDVVRKAVDALRGQIEISTRPGQGTTFSIKLPLTLAIIDGLLVEVGKERFILPLSAVEECIELRREAAAKAHGRDLVSVRGAIVPFIRLRRQFGVPGEAPPIEQVVVANLEGTRVGFAVDHVVGSHQTVIKSLGRMYHGLEGLSGATILGDGAVALILDLSQLMKKVEARSAIGSWEA